MDPIKGMNQIAQILRQKLGERKLSQVKTDSENYASKTAPSAGGAAKASVEEIKRRIGERIASLPEEEKSSARAVHIFVELVMVWEFGEQLLQDPQFSDLSDEVVKTMSENPAIWKKMQALLTKFYEK